MLRAIYYFIGRACGRRRRRCRPSCMESTARTMSPSLDHRRSVEVKPCVLWSMNLCTLPPSSPRGQARSSRADMHKRFLYFCMSRAPRAQTCATASKRSALSPGQLHVSTASATRSGLVHEERPAFSVTACRASAQSTTQIKSDCCPPPWTCPLDSVLRSGIATGEYGTKGQTFYSVHCTCT